MPKRNSPKRSLSPYKMRQYKKCLRSKGGVAQSLTLRSGKPFNRKSFCEQSYGLKRQTKSFKKLMTHAKNIATVIKRTSPRKHTSKLQKGGAPKRKTKSKRKSKKAKSPKRKTKSKTKSKKAKSPKRKTKSKKAKSPKRKTKSKRKSKKAKSPKRKTKSKSPKRKTKSKKAKSPKRKTKSKKAKSPKRKTKSKKAKSPKRKTKSKRKSKKAKSPKRKTKSKRKSKKAKSPKRKTKSKRKSKKAKSPKRKTKSKRKSKKAKSPKRKTKSKRKSKKAKSPKKEKSSKQPKPEIQKLSQVEKVPVKEMDLEEAHEKFLDYIAFNKPKELKEFLDNHGELIHDILYESLYDPIYDNRKEILVVLFDYAKKTNKNGITIDIMMKNAFSEAFNWSIRMANYLLKIAPKYGFDFSKDEYVMERLDRSTLKFENGRFVYK